eukprot:4506212-Pyramimonas_sp.AAC.1
MLLAGASDRWNVIEYEYECVDSWLCKVTRRSHDHGDLLSVTKPDAKKKKANALDSAFEMFDAKPKPKDKANTKARGGGRGGRGRAARGGGRGG